MFSGKKKSSPTYNFHGIKMKVITFIPLIASNKKNFTKKLGENRVELTLKIIYLFFL